MGDLGAESTTICDFPTRLSRFLQNTCPWWNQKANLRSLSLGFGETGRVFLTALDQVRCQGTRLIHHDLEPRINGVFNFSFPPPPSVPKPCTPPDTPPPPPHHPSQESPSQIPPPPETPASHTCPPPSPCSPDKPAARPPPPAPALSVSAACPRPALGKPGRCRQS